MEEKTYLSEMVQNFGDEQTAEMFVKMISEYLSSDQVKRDGCKVTCYANRKSESWFLTLFSMNVIMKRAGKPVPKEVMMCMVNLAADFDNEEKANLVEDLFESVGLSQQKIMESMAR